MVAFTVILLTVLNLRPAHAIINFYATGVHTGQPIIPACTDAGRVRQNYLKEFHHPAQWNYIIACDDKALGRR